MRTVFTLATAMMLAAALAPDQSHAANLAILVNFNGTDGAAPRNSVLIADANGHLFGTTSEGGSSASCPYITDGVSGCGTVFEIGFFRTFGAWILTGPVHIYDKEIETFALNCPPPFCRFSRQA
jgi:hypothetical protein